MVDRSKENEGFEDGREQGFRQQKKMKSSTHLMSANTEWYFSKAIVVSATFPCIPPAVVRPSMATCFT